MPATPPRTKWLSESRNGYTGIDEYVGSRCMRMVLITKSKKQADTIRDLLNNAYQTGREEVMKELAELVKQGGGSAYVLEMLEKMGKDIA